MTEISHEAAFMAENASRSVFWSWLYKFMIIRLFRELSRESQRSLLRDLEAILEEDDALQ